MKITDDQAARLFEAAKNFYRRDRKDRDYLEWSTELQYVLAEIEASNRPPEIRWCVRHGGKAMSQAHFPDGCCTHTPRYDGECEIAVYRFEKWEEKR